MEEKKNIEHLLPSVIKPYYYTVGDRVDSTAAKVKIPHVSRMHILERKGN